MRWDISFILSDLSWYLDRVEVKWDEESFKLLWSALKHLNFWNKQLNRTERESSWTNRAYSVSEMRWCFSISHDKWENSSWFSRCPMILSWLQSFLSRICYVCEIHLSHSRVKWNETARLTHVLFWKLNSNMVIDLNGKSPHLGRVFPRCASKPSHIAPLEDHRVSRSEVTQLTTIVNNDGMSWHSTSCARGEKSSFECGGLPCKSNKVSQLWLFYEWSNVTQLNSNIAVRNLDSNEMTCRVNQINGESSQLSYATSLHSWNATSIPTCAHSTNGVT